MSSTILLEVQEIDDMATRTDIFYLSLDELIIDNEFNPRSNEDVERRALELYQSIYDHGIETPVNVWMEKADGETRYHLVNGFTRVRAVELCRESGKEVKIPAKKITLVGKTKEEKDLELLAAHIYLNDSEPLNITAQAEVIKRMIEIKPDVTDTELSQAIGKSLTHVANLVRLIQSPEEVQEMVANGEVSPTLAINVLKEYDDESSADILTEAVQVAKSEGKTRATNKHVKKALQEDSITEDEENMFSGSLLDEDYELSPKPEKPTKLVDTRPATIKKFMVGLIEGDAEIDHVDGKVQMTLTKEQYRDLCAMFGVDCEV